MLYGAVRPAGASAFSAPQPIAAAAGTPALGMGVSGTAYVAFVRGIKARRVGHERRLRRNRDHDGRGALALLLALGHQLFIGVDARLGFGLPRLG